MHYGKGRQRRLPLCLSLCLSLCYVPVPNTVLIECQVSVRLPFEPHVHDDTDKYTQSGAQSNL